MPNPLNKWRYTNHWDEGMTQFQCLSCKKFFWAGSAPAGQAGATYTYEDAYKFCPHCGTKWDGEHWWDRDKDYEMSRAISERRQHCAEWVLESITLWLRDGKWMPLSRKSDQQWVEEKKDWPWQEKTRLSDVSASTAQEIFEEMVDDETEQEPFPEMKEVFRVRLIPPAGEGWPSRRWEGDQYRKEYREKWDMKRR